MCPWALRTVADESVPIGGQYREGMKTQDKVMLVGGLILVAAGVVWTLQGLGILGGSVMSGVTLWAIIGPVTAVVGVYLVMRARR